MHTCFRIAAACFLLCPWISSQELLWQRVGGGQPPVWYFGPSSFIDDVDGDGYDELVHVGKGLNAQGLQETQCFILSGKDGSTLRIDHPPSIEYSFGGVGAAGDWDGDGLRDYAVFRQSGSASRNVVEIRSAAHGHPLFEVSGPFGTQYGLYFTSDLDVDGDDKPDLIVGASREPPRGVIHVYNHYGHELYSIRMPHWGLGSFGGDLDRDECDDFIVGTSDEDNRGAALVYSGRTGTLILAGVGEKADGLGSGDNKGCGDVDGDGVLDFVSSSQGGFFLRGVVRVFSGRDGHELYAWDHGVASGYGADVGVADLDLDGISDVLIATVFCANGSGDEWRSLRDGSYVTTICRPENLPYVSGFGASIAIGRPQPGSPFPVVAITEHQYIDPRSGQYGRLHLFRAAPPGVAELGHACAGTLHTEPRLGFTAYSTFTRIHLSQAPPDSTALLLLGLTTAVAPYALPLGLERFGFPGCELYVPVQIAPVITTGGDGVGHGHAYFDLPQPVAAMQAAFSLSGQWLVLGKGDRFPGALSRGLSWPH